MNPSRLLAVALALVAGAGGCASEPDAPSPPQASDADRSEATPERRARDPVRTGGEPRVSTVATGIEAPWELAFLPDGRALLTERAGRVRMLTRGLRLQRDPVAVVDVAAVGEGGLLGLAVDPGFRRNGFVYLYRTTEGGNEVARFRLARGRLREEATIVRGIQANSFHDGGRIHFGPDRRLYVATGEAGNRPLSQDPDSLNGKILRARDIRGRGGRPEIVSLGHRNVQGLDWQPRSDRLFATEFGEDSHDELNVIRAGRNYGWPEAEGRGGPARFEDPLVDYEQVIAPSGGTFVSRGGSSWTGSFVFACLAGEQLRRVGLRGERVTADEPLFEGRFGRLRTVVEGPDGALYALTNNTDGRGSPRTDDDRILRIVPPRR